MTKWQNEMRAKVKAGDPEALAKVPHGITGYNYGHRCDKCIGDYKAWITQYRRAQGVKPNHSPEAKAEALRIYAEQGGKAAAAASGIPLTTIRSWASHEGVKAGKRALSPCGTRAAYARHRWNGEEACDECKAANARDHNRTVASLIERAQAGELPIPHGTIKGYSLRGCKCDLCRAANTRQCAPYQASYRERQRSKTG